MDSYKVYSITNLVSGKVYVGSTYRDIATRWKEHSYPSNNKELGKDLRKLGLNNFEFKVLEEVSPIKVEQVEKEWIFKLNALKKVGGYNTYPGFFKVFL